MADRSASGDPYPVDVYATAEAPRPADAILASGAGLGMESSNNRPGDGPIEFVDFPFTEPDASFEDHLAVVAREQPEVAVAPDVEDGRDPAQVYDQADQLLEAGADAVVVVPKDIHPLEVPTRFRVGVPLANFGDGDDAQAALDGETTVDAEPVDWPWPEYRDAGDLHLLGGSPTLQRLAGRYLPNVASVDTSVPIMVAKKGGLWAPTRDRNWHDTGPEQFGLYERVTHSYDNMARTWADDRDYASPVEGDTVVPVEPERYAEAEDARRQKAHAETDRAYQRTGARGAPRNVNPDEADLWAPGEIEEMGATTNDYVAEINEAEKRREKALRNDFDQAGLGAFGGGGDHADFRRLGVSL